MSSNALRHAENVVICASNAACVNDSARLCYDDSVICLKKGWGEYAIRRALKSICYAFGRNSKEYKEAEKFAAPYKHFYPTASFI